MDSYEQLWTLCPFVISYLCSVYINYGLNCLTKNNSTMSKAYKEVTSKVMRYRVYMYNYKVHNSMISSTGQWSEPKMSVCMLADVTDGMMRFEHKK